MAKKSGKEQLPRKSSPAGKAARLKRRHDHQPADTNGQHYIKAGSQKK